jgi:hypothetical protein
MAGTADAAGAKKNIENNLREQHGKFVCTNNKSRRREYGADLEKAIEEETTYRRRDSSMSSKIEMTGRPMCALSWIQRISALPIGQVGIMEKKMIE